MLWVRRLYLRMSEQCLNFPLNMATNKASEDTS